MPMRADGGRFPGALGKKGPSREALRTRTPHPDPNPTAATRVLAPRNVTHVHTRFGCAREHALDVDAGDHHAND
jgi:hypothetical protein